MTKHEIIAMMMRNENRFEGDPFTVQLQKNWLPAWNYRLIDCAMRSLPN